MEFKWWNLLSEVKVSTEYDFHEPGLTWMDEESEKLGQQGFMSMGKFVKRAAYDIYLSLRHSPDGNAVQHKSDRFADRGVDFKYGQHALPYYGGEATTTLIGTYSVGAVQAISDRSQGQSHRKVVQVKPVKLYVKNDPKATHGGYADVEGGVVVVNIPRNGNIAASAEGKNLWNVLAHEITHIFDLYLKQKRQSPDYKQANPDASYRDYRRQDHEKIANNQGYAFDDAENIAYAGSGLDPQQAREFRRQELAKKQARDQVIMSDPVERRRYFKELGRRHLQPAGGAIIDMKQPNVYGKMSQDLQAYRRSVSDAEEAAQKQSAWRKALRGVPGKQPRHPFAGRDGVVDPDRAKWNYYFGRDPLATEPNQVSKHLERDLLV